MNELNDDDFMKYYKPSEKLHEDIKIDIDKYKYDNSFFTKYKDIIDIFDIMKITRNIRNKDISKDNFATFLLENITKYKITIFQFLYIIDIHPDIINKNITFIPDFKIMPFDKNKFENHDPYDMFADDGRYDNQYDAYLHNAILKYNKKNKKIPKSLYSIIQNIGKYDEEKMDRIISNKMDKSNKVPDHIFDYILSFLSYNDNEMRILEKEIEYAPVNLENIIFGNDGKRKSKSRKRK